jgi:hypothetical protein
MLGAELYDATTGKTYRHMSMLELLKDWAGGCVVRPGNTDVIETVVSSGIMNAGSVIQLAHRVKATMAFQGEQTPQGLTEVQLATIISECILSRHVRARLIRHASKYHGVPRKAAKQDLRELSDEVRTIMRRGGLTPTGES